MKPLLIATIAGLVALSAAGQVVVTLNNSIYGCVRSPVYGPEPGDPLLSKTGNTTAGTPSGTQTYGGPLLSGLRTNMAQLFAAPGIWPEDGPLMPASPPVLFRNPNAEGYVTVTNVLVPFLSFGGSATFQLRAWDSLGGAFSNWMDADYAWLTGWIAAGKSPLLYVTNLQASPVDPPTRLCGLLSFNIHYLPAPPVITTQPANQAIPAGQDATFSVVATGGALSYQWRLNGTDLSAATAATCTITSAGLGDRGLYDVVIANFLGSATSSVAALAVLLPGAAPVTFQVDMSAQIAAGNFHPAAGDRVQARGSFQMPALWTGGFWLTPSAANTNIYEGIYGVTNASGTTQEYKFVIIQAGDDMNSWNHSEQLDLPHGNRSFVVAGGAQVLPVVYYGNQPPADAPALHPITFQVNMGVQAARGLFRPNLGDTVEVRGNFQTNSWWSAGCVLTSSGGDPNLFTGTFYDNNAPGAELGYKFVKVPAAGSPVWESMADNRVLVEPGPNGLVLPEVYFNNDTNYLPPVLVTFAVDMSVPIRQGTFTPGTDYVEARGSFQEPDHWSAGFVLTNNPNGPYTNLYTGTYTVYDPWGTGEEYKFVVDGGANLGWELPLSTGGGNRSFVLAAGPTQALPPVTFNDVGVVLITQPSGGTAAAGSSFAFAAAAAGVEPLAWQWRVNGANLADGARIQGAQTNQLVISAIQDSDAGSYTVVVTNAYGSVTSAVATLTVLIAPSISVQPTNQTILVGQPVTFSIAAAGSAPLDYQWQHATTNIPAATESCYTIPAVQITDGGAYQVVVTNLAGSVTSSVATLTVGRPAVITRNPLDLWVVAGQDASFGVTAAGTYPLYYQWRFNGTSVTANSSAYATYTWTNVQPDAAGSYSVVVSNQFNTVTSTVAVLTVLTTPGTPFVRWDFNSVPPDADITTGTPLASFGAGFANPVGGVTNWFATGSTNDPAPSDNSSLSTARYPAPGTSNKLAGIRFDAPTVGWRDLVIRWDGYSSPTSSKFCRLQYTTNGMDFLDAPVANWIVRPSVFEPKTVSLVGLPGVDDNPAFAFRLVAEFESTAAGTTYENYVGTASGGYSPNATARFDMVTVSGTPTSTPMPPSITAQPTNQTILADQAAVFSVSATGTQPLSYQWRFYGTNLAGVTASAYIIAPAQTNHSGPYTVLVTNAYGSVTSAVATLTVLPPGFVQLDLKVNPALGGVIIADPAPVAGAYSNGTVVTLTAQPASGYQFAGWSGDATGPTNPTPVTMNANKSVTAQFRGPAYNSFDVATSAGSWITWPTWGLQFPIVWDPTVDRSGSPASGSLRWVVPFTGAAGDQLMSFGTFANRWPWDDSLVLGGTRFARFSFDLKVAPGTAPTILGNYGDLELGLLHEGPAEWERIALPGLTLPLTNDWVHVVSPIDPAAPGIDAIVGMYLKLWSGGNFTNTFTFNVDNLLLEPGPAVPLRMERAGAGLQLVWTGGTLQQADAVSGPYSDLPGAVSPFTVTPVATAQFYRLQGPNLAQNPGFEAGTSGWLGFGAALTTATNVFHSGTHSGFVTNRVDIWNGMAQMVAGVLEPGREYRISAWARLAGGSPQPVQLTIKKTDTSGTTYQNVASAMATSDGWTQLQGTYTLTVSGVLTELLLYMEGPPAGVDFYADDFMIEP